MDWSVCWNLFRLSRSEPFAEQKLIITKFFSIYLFASVELKVSGSYDLDEIIYKIIYNLILFLEYYL